MPPADVTSIPSTTHPVASALPVVALSVGWSDAVKPCALAALVACGLMSLGLNPFVAMVSVGFLAVVFYRQRRPAIAITPFAGARLGALSGLLWFAMSSILGAVVILVMNKGPEIQKALIEVIQQAISRTSDPQAVAMLERFKSPEGLQFLMVFGIVSSLIAAIVLACLGGALGGTIFGRRNKG